MRKPAISIAIPTYHREEVLIDTIRDALAQSEKNIEVLVIDQSKQHKPQTSRALLAISDKRYRYFLVDPPSVTAARNFALRVALAPIVLFLDDDVKLDKDLARYHLQAYQEHPDVSAVGGRVLQAGFPIKKEVLRFDDFAIPHGVFTATASGLTNAFAGGNCSLKVSDALAVGGFDTRYYGNAFREESDMSLKMSGAGMKIWYESRAELLHLAAPYGGNRVKGHIYDRAVFYPNEIFFTLRHAKRHHRLKALWKKYQEYCAVPSKRIRLKRSFYFVTGFFVAVGRFIFSRPTIAKERIV